MGYSPQTTIVLEDVVGQIETAMPGLLLQLDVNIKQT